MGVQCKCCNKLMDGNCSRIGNVSGIIGVCWMEYGEGEY